jgi:CBS-domain-containing membrane protein
MPSNEERSFTTQKVKSAMTTEVLFVDANETMDKVETVFNTHPIHHLPVLNNGQVVGMLSKTDYLKILHGLTLFKSKKSEEVNKALLRSLLVKEVMTHPAVTIGPERTLQFAADIFKENLFHAVPVVDDEGELLGILSTFDLLVEAYKDPPLQLR